MLNTSACTGHLNFAEGGAAHDVIEGIKKYGIVPQEVYPGLNYGTEKPVFGEPRRSTESLPGRSYQGKNNGVLATAWQDGLNALLDTYFGVRLKIHLRRQGIYPRIVRSVAADQNGRLCIHSLFHAPSFLLEFIIEVPDNWMWETVYNVPLER